MARERAVEHPGIVWLRDDACASALSSTFDVIVDRAVLHVLPRERAYAWAATVTRLCRGVVIVKAHRDKWTAAAIAQLLPAFELVVEQPAELPGGRDPTPVPSVLAVLRRR